MTEKGLDLIELCELNGLPEGSYTLVEQIVSPELTAAFRRDADVCLHPSKTEGFGAEKRPSRRRKNTFQFAANGVEKGPLFRRPARERESVARAPSKASDL